MIDFETTIQTLKDKNQIVILTHGNNGTVFEYSSLRWGFIKTLEDEIHILLEKGTTEEDFFNKINKACQHSQARVVTDLEGKLISHTFESEIWLSLMEELQQDLEMAKRRVKSQDN